MARFNEILVGRYNRFLQKLLSMKGPPPAPQLTSEITTVLNLFNGAENRYLEGWQKFGAAGATGLPAAGNRAAWRLRNPANSNVIAVVEKITVSQVTAQDFTQFFYDAIAAALPGEVATILVRNLIPRNLQVGATCIPTISTNFGVLGTPFYDVSIPNLASYDLITFEDQEIELSPNSEITVAEGALVQNVVVAMIWRERFLEDSERA